MTHNTRAEIVPWPADPEAQRQVIARAASLIRSGEVVAFPTDTVYGIGAYTWDPAAVQKLFAIKERPGHKAIALLLSGPEQIPDVTDYRSPDLCVLARRFWPGGLTVVVPWRPDIVASGKAPFPTVGIRVPDHPIPRVLIAEIGTPLATTSANLSGAPSPTTAQEVDRQIGSRIALIIDGGTCPGGTDSTVVDLTTRPPTIRRIGAVSVEELASVLGPLMVDGKIWVRAEAAASEKGGSTT
ncbi:MAG: L-threonylcarbamoyladenylate synthase [Sphingomonadaceae bacterium]